MPTFHNLSLITVLLANAKANVLTIVHEGQLQKTAGNPLLVNIPVSDAIMHAACGTLETTYNNFKAVPPTATKSQVNQQVNLVVNSYNKNALFIQYASRDAANAAGDINLGIQLALNSGYKIKKTKGAVELGFKVTQAGVGAVNITSKAVSKHACYIRQYGITTAKGVPPEVLSEYLITPEVDIHISNLKSATIYAFREASVLTVKRKAKSGTPTTDTERLATPTIADKAHKPIFIDGTATHYVWSDWIYVVVL
jgi:hypothetical protein